MSDLRTSDASCVRLSCCIITKNEADRIARCINAIRDIADDIVVVDSGSTDDTISIAERLGARVFTRPWDGFGPQKRYAEDCARNDWLLNIDADEVITPQLAAEIADLLRQDPLLRAYRFKQVTVYPHQSQPRLWADYHNYVRLYDRRAVRFRESLVHDTVDTGGMPVGQLRGIALHYSWRSLEHMRLKLNSYTDLQAKEISKPRWQLRLRAPFEYPILFARYYIFRRHITGGLYGVKTAHTIARGRAQRIAKFLKASEARKSASAKHES